ncbi:haloacid dehalogenase [Roridomyces roridus]|uniref:Haloacid dehalogenase n=1 Tax=Roridomyces roridus TaxID=1738132 RepID=A0AAD7BHB3_9AGAR|nr:haloacid dehalogenase [Roridomyces roridus]
MSLTDQFKVIIFDCYGTLADWERGIYVALQPLLARFPSSASWTRKEALLAFTEIEKDLQAKEPSLLYRDLLAKAYEAMANTLSAQADPTSTADFSAEGRAFGDSIPAWPIFPDTCDALRVLEKHYKLVILSNVDHASFAHTHAKLSGVTDSAELPTYTLPVPNPNAHWLPQTTPNSRSPFSLILTAQDTGAYKPDPQGMLAALQIIEKEFGVGKDGVLVVAQSLFHDIEPSSKLGVSTVWIDRQGACMGLETINEPPKWLRRFETLGEMAAAVETNA